jgi:NAD(P)-dependent dehydrogenase (short-subunit alcohol dehydrogenase family)
MRLSGKVALVTGGGTGIGAATARRFAAEGARVVLLGLEPGPLAATAGEIEGLAVAGDAADPTIAEAAVDEARGRFGGLDCLVTCAGTGDAGSLLEASPEAWSSALRNNLESAATAARAALPAIVDREGGSITLISSVGGLTAGPGIAGYSTAKAGLLGLMRSLAVDFGPRGVRVNAVCPGWVRTPMSETVLAGWASERGISLEEAFERVNAVVPLRRAASPDEIAGVCLFLASADASFVTGSVLVADGGQTAVNVGAIPLASD